MMTTDEKRFADVQPVPLLRHTYTKAGLSSWPTRKPSGGLWQLSNGSWKQAHGRLRFSALEFHLVYRFGMKFKEIYALSWFPMSSTSNTLFHVNVPVPGLTGKKFELELRSSGHHEKENVIKRGTVDTSGLLLQKVLLLSGQLSELEHGIPSLSEFILDPTPGNKCHQRTTTKGKRNI